MHKPLPGRKVGDRLIVARPADGAAIAFGPVVASLWPHLDEWCEVNEIERVLADLYPSIPTSELGKRVVAVLRGLYDEGLLERSDT
jgi:hypothetical protein